MITSQCIQRMAFSSVLLVLPLIVYCSEIVGNPQPAVGSVEQTKAVASSVSSTAEGAQKEDKALARQVVIDMEKAVRPES